MNKKHALAWAIFLALGSANELAMAAEPSDETDAETAPSGSPATTLDELVVTDRFIASGAESAMKMDVTVLDTPYSVTAYSEEFLRDIASTNVADLYRYMTGIQKAGGTGYDLTIRGFNSRSTDRNSIMVDGLPGLPGRFGSPPTVGVEQVEVVKGPASVLYGQAQPGGFVNLVTKKPQNATSHEIMLKASTFASDHREFGEKSGSSLAMDSTGPLDNEGRFLYRFIAEKSDGLNAWRDNAFTGNLYVAPSLVWNISDATRLTLLSEYRDSRNAYDRGLVAPSFDIDRIAPIETSYQEPGDYQEETAKTLSAVVNHYLDNGATWNFSVRGLTSDDGSSGFDNAAIRPNQTMLGRRAATLVNDRTSLFIDTNIVFEWQTASVLHRIVAGAGGGRDSLRATRLQFFTGPATGPTSLDISIYDPVNGLVPDRSTLPLGVITDRDNSSTAAGVYVSDLMEISDHWKINIGARASEEGQRIRNVLSTAPPQEKDERKVLPMVGLMYQPTEEWTIYSSFSTSFVPAAVTDQDINAQNPFGPEYSEQLEVGAKVDLLDGRLQSTLSLFTITKEDVINGFACPPGVPASGTCSEQIGEQQSRGFEFEINARPTENLQLIGGYSRVDARITEALDPVQVDARATNAPDSTAHLWAKYQLPRGFGIGGGVSYTGDRTGNVPSTGQTAVLQLPSYALADLALYYRYKKTSMSLRLDNVFDKDHIESAGVTPQLQVQPGRPRQLIFLLSHEF